MLCKCVLVKKKTFFCKLVSLLLCCNNLTEVRWCALFRLYAYCKVDANPNRTDSYIPIRASLTEMCMIPFLI
jgi:hypothetical protein